MGNIFKRFTIEEKNAANDKANMLFDLFSMYRTMEIPEAAEKLPEELNDFLKDAENIKNIILRPADYAFGDILSEIYVKLFELFYVISRVNYMLKTPDDSRDRIFALIFDVHKHIDSSVIQEQCCVHFIDIKNDENDKATSRKLFTVLEHFAYTNMEKLKKIHSSNEAKENADLIKRQQEILDHFLLYGNKMMEEKLWFKEKKSMQIKVITKNKYGPFSAQLLNAVFMKTLDRVTEEFISVYLNKKEMKSFKNILHVVDAADDSLGEVLRYCQGYRFPHEMGCYYMQTVTGHDEFYDAYKFEIIDDRLRIYALRRMILRGGGDKFHMARKALNVDPWDMFFGNKGDMKKVFELADTDDERLVLLKEEDKEFLLPVAEKIIAGGLASDKNNLYSVNINAELLLLSVVLKALRYGDEKLDMIETIKAIPSVMSFKTAGTGHGYQIIQDKYGALLLLDCENNRFVETIRSFADGDDFPKNIDDFNARLKEFFDIELSMVEDNPV